MPKVERTASGSWRIRWTDDHGQRQCITKPTSADARAAYRRALADQTTGTYVNPRKGRLALTDWCGEWLAGARNLGTGGRETYERDLERHILPALGKLRLGAITPADIDAYLNGLTLAPSTVHRHYRTLHRVFAVAVERGRLAKNPCDPVQPPRVPKRDVTVLSVAQVDDLAEAISPRYRAWVYVVAYGGLRWSETLGLRRGRVEGATLRVVEQLVRRASGEWERCEPKAGSKRTVTLPTFAAAELAYHLERYSLPGPDGLVFPTRNGTPPLAPSWTQNTFKRALARAGLPPIRVHDLRHTAISLAISSGANPKLSQLRAGHSSIGIHFDTYGHLLAGADQSVADALDEMRAKALRARLRAV